MKKTILKFLAAVMCVLVVSSARGALSVAVWQFNSYTSGNLSSFKADYGTQVSTATASSTSGTTASRITGTAVNETATSSPNYGIQMPSGNGSSTANSVLTLKVSGTSLYNFVITYASQDNNNTGYAQTWQWSVDGNTWTATGITGGTVNAANGTWTTYTVDFSSVTAINGAANVYFRDTIAFSGNNQTTSFDNIAINASVNVVPEPTHYALAAFGLVFVGGVAGRRLLTRRQQS